MQNLKSKNPPLPLLLLLLLSGVAITFSTSVAGAEAGQSYDVKAFGAKIIYPGGGVPRSSSVPLDRLDSTPELPAKYPEYWMFGELPAWGLYLRHAENIHCDQVRISLKTSDYRAAMVTDDVHRLELDDLTIQPGGSTIVLQGVDKLAFNGKSCDDAAVSVQSSENCPVNLLRVKSK